MHPFHAGFGFLRSSSRVVRVLTIVAMLPCGSSLAAVEPGDHEHGTGANGGLILPLGRENYHIEPVFEPGGVLRLYLLGADETRVQETERQTLKAFVKHAGGRETVSIEIAAEPQEGDAEGMTSRFRGVLPESLREAEVEVMIPNLRIEGQRFRVGFSSVMPQHHEDAAMPAPLADDASATLFLTPGGRYTEADIEANGRVTAKQKFKAFMAKHDMHPKRGDLICPITETKANPACAWVIGGLTYQFCCPPCVEEFLRQAKESPDQIKEPEAYVKQ